jgi:phosphate transport system permease protein
MSHALPKTRRGWTRHLSRAFEFLCLSATLFSIVLLVVLLGSVFFYGASSINWTFLTHNASNRDASQSGILFALVGSIWLIVLTTMFTVPIGIGTAIYLEEYAPKNLWRKIIETNISNLSGVPSIIYAILGLGLFVRAMDLKKGVLAGALTLTLVVLPIVIIAAQESLRAVPSSLRHGSLALGATRWQTIWHQVLPVAMPGIMTGVILALSRALGEAAPLITIGAVTYGTHMPRGLTDPFTAMPIQIFFWSDRPQPEFQNLAAGAIIVLMVLLLILNGAAVAIRHRYARGLGGR